MVNESKRNGRPTKLTKKRIQTICNYVRLGSWVETAAQASGICKQTLYTWLKCGNDVIERIAKGEEINNPEEKLQVKFVEMLNEATAESELIDVERIDKAAENGVWQASAWRLERRHPERWAKREFSEVAMSGPDKCPLQIESSVESIITVQHDVGNELFPYLAAIATAVGRAQSEVITPNGAAQPVDAP